LTILDWRIAIKPIAIQQSQIDNPKTHPLPRTVLTSCHKAAFAKLFSTQLFGPTNLIFKEKQTPYDILIAEE